MTHFVGKFFAFSGNTNLSQNRIHQNILNIGAVPGTFFYLFSYFSYDAYIILPRDVLLLGILSS
jgi:hypothetical protein